MGSCLLLHDFWSDFRNLLHSFVHGFKSVLYGFSVRSVRAVRLVGFVRAFRFVRFVVRLAVLIRRFALAVRFILVQRHTAEGQNRPGGCPGLAVGHILRHLVGGEQPPFPA